MVNLAILDFIGKMKQFALVWVMTRGGPMWGTETVATYVVKRAFEWKTLDLGYPSAIAVLWFVIIFGLSLVLHAPPPAARGAGVLSVRGRLGRWLLLVPGPRLHRLLGGPVRLDRDDVAPHDGRDLPEPLRPADPRPLGQVPPAWTEFGYATYFRNSAIVTVAAVVIVTVLGAMAGFAFARRRYAFPLREPLFLLVFLSIMFPPQIMLLSLFQILVQYGLFNTLTGLVLVYVATELPLTIYLLRAFFAQIPTELEEAARIDGCSDWSHVLARHVPDGAARRWPPP